MANKITFSADFIKHLCDHVNEQMLETEETCQPWMIKEAQESWSLLKGDEEDWEMDDSGWNDIDDEYSYGSNDDDDGDEDIV